MGHRRIGHGRSWTRPREGRLSERWLEVYQAGVVPYAEALAWQRALAAARIDGRLAHDLLLLLEHPPVVTLGRNSSPAHVLRPDGVDVFETERGGDVTFHGPGQLVGYPILHLARYKPDLHWYLRTLEEALVIALAELGIPAGRNPPFTGVWTRNRKIASIGVHVKRWVTWHGFALNVTTDLAQFERIVPCGIAGVEMTSVEREQGAGSWEQDPWDRAVHAVMRGFEAAFGVTTMPAEASVWELRPAAAVQTY